MKRWLNEVSTFSRCAAIERHPVGSASSETCDAQYRLVCGGRGGSCRTPHPRTSTYMSRQSNRGGSLLVADGVCSIQRIQSLERKLEQTRRSGDCRALPDETPHQLELPDRGTSPGSIYSSVSANGPSTLAASAGSQLNIASSTQSQSDLREVEERTGEACEAGVAVEGLTSLSAHSTMAIGFLNKVAGETRQGKDSAETQELLDALKHIIQAIKTQYASPRTDFTSSRLPLQQKTGGSSMPPIEASVAAIREGQGKQER